VEGERQPAPEIAPAPASEAPVAAAIGPALGTGMGPAVNGLTTPAAVLALQRSAGNAAVTRALLARDEAKTEEKTKVSGPGDFTATGGEPKGEGVTTVGKDPADATKAKAVAPKVTMPATVKLNPGKTLGNETGQLGHIQNLTNSTRGGTYRKGGDPQGEIVSDYRGGRSNRRDAASDPTDDKKIHPGATFPFYWPPVPIDDNAENLPVETKADTYDKPEFKLPIESDGGRLTNFVGQDDFLLAAAVKTSYGIFKFDAFTWSANWDVAVDKDMNGAGEALTKAKAKLGQSPDENLTDWSLREGSSDVWEAFATPEEAMKRTAAELLQWVGPARSHDPVSHRNIVAALTAKNPRFSATFTCGETSDLVGRDTVHIKASAGGDSYKTDTVKLKKGESQVLLFTLNELFGSADAIGVGSQVTLEVTHVDSGEEATATFKLTGSKDLKVGSGTYTVSLTVA
jgi:hypothetical protein